MLHSTELNSNKALAVRRTRDGDMAAAATRVRVPTYECVLLDDFVVPAERFQATTQPLWLISVDVETTVHGPRPQDKRVATILAQVRVPDITCDRIFQRCYVALSTFALQV